MEPSKKRRGGVPKPRLWPRTMSKQQRDERVAAERLAYWHAREREALARRRAKAREGAAA